MKRKNLISRRDFIARSGMALGAGILSPTLLAAAGAAPTKKLRLAMVGTGIRACTMWGNTVMRDFGDVVEFVGLCDKNPGRLAAGKKMIGTDCPTFTDFKQMMSTTKPDYLLVMTTDSSHDTFIIEGMAMGANIITEKPMTTDETKCAAILAAEAKYGKKIIVTFNYRYGTLFTKMKELLQQQTVGQVTSIDLNWYLNVYHGADYFRRWHAYTANSGSLWVHKATHHFDLLNWWLDSDPVEVSAYGSLDHYGKNGTMRHTHCRTCPHKKECPYFFDIMAPKHKDLQDLYVANESYDGYLRDACVFRNDIDIFDKMSAQIKYANGVVVNYSLTSYSPYEGLRLGVNGTLGRIDTWEGVPYLSASEGIDQANLHTAEMAQGNNDERTDQIAICRNFKAREILNVKTQKSGHGGGDGRLKTRIFRTPTTAPDPMGHVAGTRDGALSILVGIAARKSIALKRPVLLSELTDIKLMPKRG